MTDTMNLCNRADDYLDARIDDDGQLAFEAHLDACPVCRAKVAEWQQIKVTYGEWVKAQVPTDVQMPGGDETAAFARGLTHKMADQPVTRLREAGRIRPLFRIIAAAAVICFGIIGVLRLMESPLQDAEPRFAKKAPTPATPTTIRLSTIRYKDGIPTKTVLRATPGQFIDVTGTDRLLATIADDRLGFDNGSVFSVSAASKTHTRLELKMGTVACEVAPRKAGKGSFVIVAGEVTVKVVGTRYSVSIDKRQRVQVLVEDGVVHVSRGIHQLELAKGEAVTVSATELITEQATAKKLATISRLLQTTASQSVPASGIDRAVTPKDSGRAASHPFAARDLSGWRKLILEGSLDEAFRKLNEFLKRHPDDTDARLLLATCQRKKGDHRGAVDTYKRVAEGGTNSAANRARYLAGEIAQTSLQDHRSAITFFESYLQHVPPGSPNIAEAKMRLAQSLLQTGNKARARQLLQQVVSDYGRTPIANRARKLLAEQP